MKKIGCLMPISALPSNYGIGDLGYSANEFVDILTQTGMKIWQLLPLNPLGYGNSPYQAYSSFAGDEIYISLDKLAAAGLIDANNLKPFNPHAKYVDYFKTREYKQPLLQEAFKNFIQNKYYIKEYQNFVKQNEWVTNYAIFLTFKKINKLNLWTKWPDKYKNWIKNRSLDISAYQEQINYEIFIQFIFYWQWQDLKTYANKCGIEVMGDIPIYLGLDSADVWANQEMFLLDESGNPTYVAGVPPDFFSKTGQRWGNPIYNWTKLKETGFKFWVNRLSGNARLFDILRIDHFRAFDTYWQIPSSCKTAVDGTWVEAPGYELLDTVYRELPNIKIVAEDLGDLRAQVHKLLNHYQLPGMKVFQFHFNVAGDNANFENTVNTVIYTGTHDNTTLLAWYKTLSPQYKKQIRHYFKITNNGPKTIARDLKWAIISYLLRCSAQYVIFPIQDILGLDADARLNIPSKVGSPNWEWHLVDYSTFKAEVKTMKTIIKSIRLASEQL